MIQDIQDCLTAALGGHIDACDECGHVRISYNSCRNSHCPKCQSMAREAWLEKRRNELLPVKYFHLVFTLPSELHDLVRYNERLAYSHLFKLAWESLSTLTGDKKYLGAQTGMIAVLHTVRLSSRRSLGSKSSLSSAHPLPGSGGRVKQR